MKVVEIKRLPEDDSLLGRRVLDSNRYKEIHPGTIVTCEDKPVVIYGEIGGGFREVASILKQVKYGHGQRVTQYTNDTEVNKSRDVNFGFKPRKAVYAQPAGCCAFNALYPGWYERLCDLGEFLLKKYAAFAPEKHSAHKKIVEETVAPQWRIGKTPYTQGVINNSNALGFHYDRDNFEGMWSTMAYFVNGVRGGDLIIPSLQAKLVVRNETYVLFDGQGLMHGVTPIRKLRSEGYRYSIVYYSRKSMRGLGTFEEELEKIKVLEVKKHLVRKNADTKTTS